MLPKFDSFTANEVWGLVLLSAIALTIAGFRSHSIRTHLRSRKIISLVIAASILLSSLSAVFFDRYGSGTGYRTVFGYPRTFYFIWESFQNQDKFVELNWFRFLENSLVYASILSIVLLFYWLVKLWS